MRTPPLRTKDAPLRIVTLIQHKDLTMYLLACKSVYHRLKEGKFFVIDDGSLTDEDKELIRLHLDDPRDDAPHVLLALRRPLIAELAHRRGRGDRVDGDHLVHAISGRRDRLVTVDRYVSSIAQDPLPSRGAISRTP